MALIENTYTSSVENSPEVDALSDGVFVCHDQASHLWQLAEDLEAEVFIGSGYVRTKQELATDYSKYTNSTEMVAYIDGGAVKGAIRIIKFEQGIGFKTIDDSTESDLVIDDTGKEFLFVNVDPTRAMEIGTISIEDESRGLTESGIHISTQLYGAIYESAQRNNVEWLLASFDEDYLSSFCKIFGPAVTILGPPKDYMGSKTVPVVIHVEQALQNIADIGLQDTFDSIRAVGQQLKHEY